MVKVIFEGKNISDLKLEIQEFGLIHLGLPWLGRKPEPLPLGPDGQPIKRGPGRPRKVLPNMEAPLPIPVAATPGGITREQLKVAIEHYVIKHSMSDALSILNEFGASHLNDVKPEAYEPLYYRFQVLR